MEGSNPSCYQTKATRKNVVFCFIQLSFIIIVTDVIYFVIVTGKQHLSFGIITGIAFSAYLHKLNIYQNNADMVFVVCGSVLGSLLPDIDSTESIISNILPPFTTLISKIINKNEYVFHQGDKRPISRDCVQSEIDRVIALIREDGINFERFTCHGFRHTFATRAIESGMQPQTLKTILGHLH